MENWGKPKRVALGMSGGVDSSLSAYFLLEAGYEVTGVYLECWRAPSCRTEEDRADALKVALELGIKFQVLDFKSEYKERVVEYFFKEYEAGRTPNPDVMCNKEIKFGMFYDWAMENGFDYVATGHYAQNTRVDGVRYLTSSADTHKDQTYFLYRLRQDQLDHILFPIGHLTKAQVREEAKSRGIVVADKPDSQGICFIGEINVHNFLKERLGENPGEVVNTAGDVIGKHKGLWFYTIGQRHGFEISGTWKSKQGELKHAMPPYYVIKKLPEQNQLVVGFGAETYLSEFGVEDAHWISGDLSEQQLKELLVRIRHGGKLISCSITRSETQLEVDAALKSKDSSQVKVKLDEPTQGIAEGQSAVFYQKHGDECLCLGGGVIVG
jgi:tRNA-specific 2-thiouridylase